MCYCHAIQCSVLDLKPFNFSPPGSRISSQPYYLLTYAPGAALTHPPTNDQHTQYVDAGLASEAEAAALVAQVQGLKLQELNTIFKGLGIQSSSSKETGAQAPAAAAEAPAFAPLKDVASVASTPTAQLKEWEALGA